MDGLLKVNNGDKLYDRVKALVETERALLAYVEKAFPQNEPIFAYFRKALAANLRGLAGLEEDRGDLAAVADAGRELVPLEVALHSADRWEAADARRLVAHAERLQALGEAQRGALAEAKALNRRVLRLGEEGNGWRRSRSPRGRWPSASAPSAPTIPSARPS